MDSTPDLTTIPIPFPEEDYMMKFINSEKEPTLLGLVDKESDTIDVTKMVDILNQDLKDSGYDQYQFQVKQKGKKLYIEKD